MRRPLVVQVLVAVALVGLGVAGGLAWSERRGHRAATGALTAGAGVDARGAATALGSSVTPEPVEVTLSAEAIQRAGIVVAVAGAEAVGATLSVPATITSNAYRDTKVHALVGGVVRVVEAELGAAVRRGQRLAVVFSSDLADAQMKYLAGRAMLEADHQKLERTKTLFGVGAVARQELESVSAMHEAHDTEVAAARQRLLLFGLSGGQVDALHNASNIVSEVIVTAPADGVVISRAVNPGQVVAAGQELFTVTDLGTVWAIGDLYEKDFGAVRVGTETMLSGSTAGTVLRGRVAYIDPRVDPAARTAKVRVEVPNRDGALRLGMFVTLTFQTSSTDHRLAVPREAVQTLGDRAVVYVDLGDGRYVERAVRVGGGSGPTVEVLEGLQSGERVVTAGSFFLRSESARTRSGG